MSRSLSGWLAAAVGAALLASAGSVRALDDEALGFERTPPRLSFTDGEVSFLRPGADDWTPAVVNTALAPGDELYTTAGANLELQIGARAFARAGENTQLALTSLEPDFLQLRVTSGHVSLDLRNLKTGQGFEIDTPNAAFTIERSGYYRIEVDEAATTFISRRGGRATVTPAAGESVSIAANEQVVVTGTDALQVETYAAPELDAWDRWNYARTDDQQGAVSARYVPSGVYGADDLDHYGDWRVVPSYGALWVPRGVAAGWAPYSTGRWLHDPYYGWTWVDTAPWGWAPYHYGRWVHYSGYWGWCPGPIVARPYYAPALVAFYGGGFSVGFTIGAPYVGWVALGWGEPLVPWWGPARFRGYPRWAGWGGPRFVNGHAYHHKTVYNVKEINLYRNARVRDAIVAVDRDHFGRRSRDGDRFTRGRQDRFSPRHDGPGIRPDRSSLVAEARSSRRPPREARERSVVATRQPRIDAVPGLEPSRGSRGGRDRDRGLRADSGRPDAMPAARLVQPSREGSRIQASRRSPFDTQREGERRSAQRTPRFAQREAAAQVSPPAAPRTPRERAQAERGREPTPAVSRRERPGEPASRVLRPRNERAQPAVRSEHPVREARAQRPERPVRIDQRQARIERPQRQARVERPAREPSQRADARAPEARPQVQARAQAGERSGGPVRARSSDAGDRTGGGGGRGDGGGGSGRGDGRGGNFWGGERGSSRGR